MLPLPELRRGTDTAFLDYLDDWEESLAPLPLEQVAAEAGDPSRVALFCVDLLNGFCHEGQLQSERVKRIVTPIARLFEAAYAQGVRHFVLPQDCHPPDAVEFRDFPIHCVKGTSEAETVPELLALPFAERFTVLPKRSLSAAIDTPLDEWLDAHPDVTHRIVVGDCTDLCVYQLAMHLKLRANARNLLHPVIVPADCVDTYDLGVDLARDLSVPAHPADLFHRLFLYHMALNGIRVVASLL